MKQLRFKVTVARTFFYGLWQAAKAERMIKDKTRYSAGQRYALAQKICDKMRHTSRTRTDCFGQALLPKQGGYLLIANHQGKYDALGIVLSHPEPLSVLWERKAASYILAKQVSGLMDCPTIDFAKPREWTQILQEITESLRNGGKMLIFPEGGYADNGNSLQKFNSGCFRCALEAQVPIVPVVLYDSYRAMDTNTFEPVTTQIHYLPPIAYEQFAHLKRYELCELVRGVIEEKLEALRAKAQ